jgi:hypothetical protein
MTQKQANIRRYIFIVFILIARNAAAQNDTVQTVWKTDKVQAKNFVAPEIKLHVYNSHFNESMAMLLGVKTGWIFNRHLIIGLGGYGKVTPSIYYNQYEYTDKGTGAHMSVPNQKMGVGYGYGGLILGGIFSPYKAIHATFTCLIGGGSSNEYIIQENGSHGTTFNSPGFVIVEPSLNLEFNLSTKIRYEIGTGYRYLFADRFESLTSSDLSGLNFQMSVNFGSF